MMHHNVCMFLHGIVVATTVALLILCLNLCGAVDAREGLLVLTTAVSESLLECNPGSLAQ